MKLTLRRERINRDGYNSAGCYYGTGLPLYFYISDDCKWEGQLRAFSRANAKAKVRAIHSDAKFYN